MTDSLIQNNYGDIPDDVVTKPYIAISKHGWKLFKKFGYHAFYEDAIPAISDDMIYDVFKARLDESILTAKEVIEGTISDPDKRLAWAIFPPVIPLRADLTQGSTRLLFGDSMSVTFIVLNDMNQEIFFLFNGHIENGIPVDWWVAGPQDELLQRRHLKYGFEMKDCWKKGGKDFTKCGMRVIDVLRDVRNERTPKYADSPYAVAMVWASGIAGFFVEPSMYELIGMIWDGVNAKRHYGLPDYWFSFVPWPSMLQMLTYMNRSDFIQRMSALVSGGRLCINYVEESNKEMALELISDMASEFDFWNDAFEATWYEGWPWPIQSVNCKPPNLRKKKVYEKEEFNWYYPGMENEATRFMNPEDFDMSVEEMMRGILLDITHKTKPWSVNPKDEIISIGWRRDIKVFKDMEL